MSTSKRAYNLLRSYVGREWDRIKSWERQSAIEELEETTPRAEPTSKSDEERVVVYVPEGTTHEEAARQILGVAADASFAEVRKTFERLSKRADPSRFNEGTPERRQAHDIQRKIHWAYKILSESASEAEKRFGSLEID